MQNQIRTRRIGCGLIVVAVIAAIATTTPVSAQTKAPEGWQLTIPTRRVTNAEPVGPPSLPASADSIAATTVELIVSRRVVTGRPSIIRHTVSRTADRIHIVGSDRREWLFERNPIDRRRVSATLVEHAAEAIILYAESDLRMTLGIRGWADVLAFGFDLESLNGYKRTADVRTLAGIQFARYVTDTKAAPIAEVWPSAGR